MDYCESCKDCKGAWTSFGNLCQGYLEGKCPREIRSECMKCVYHIVGDIGEAKDRHYCTANCRLVTGGEGSRELPHEVSNCRIWKN